MHAQVPVSVELSITTFGDRPSLAAGLPGWVGRVRHELVEPLVEEMRRLGTSSVGADNAWGTPGACHFGFGVETADSLRATTYKYGAAAWTRILGGLAEGRWRSVTLNGWILGGDGTPRDAPCSFTFLIDLRGFEWSGAAHHVALQISDDLAREVVGKDQERLVELVKDGARALNATSAYVARGAMSLRETPHEIAIGAPSGMGVDFSGDWLRGVEWANVLTHSHLQKLGGRDRVAREAPCEVIEGLPSSDGERLYLQVTRDLWETSEAQLEALHRFLEPALLTPAVARSGPKISLPSRDDGRPAGVADSARAPSAKKHSSRPQVDTGVLLDVVGDVDPTAIEFALEVRGDVTPEDVDALRRLLDAWYEVGLHGGFDGLFHSMSGLDTEREGAATRFLWSMDMGSAGKEALEALTRSLSELASLRELDLQRLRVS